MNKFLELRVVLIQERSNSFSYRMLNDKEDLAFHGMTIKDYARVFKTHFKTYEAYKKKFIDSDVKGFMDNSKVPTKYKELFKNFVETITKEFDSAKPYTALSIKRIKNNRKKDILTEMFIEHFNKIS